MKIRHIAIVIIAIASINAAFGGISNALKRSDYNHCKVVTKHSDKECRVLTQYEGE